MHQSNRPWLTICGTEDGALEAALAQRVRARHAGRQFSAEDEAYIGQLSRPVLAAQTTVAGERIEALRQLCRLYRVNTTPQAVTSHRKFIGRFIVMGKRILFRMFEPLLQPFVRQQRSFNAQVVYLLGQLSEEAEQTKKR